MITDPIKTSPLTSLGYYLVMKYAQRLQAAMDQAGATRVDLAKELSISQQAVGMILTSAGGRDRTLSTENNAKAARFLRVDPVWLATGEGDMNAAGTLSSSALDLDPVRSDSSERSNTPRTSL